MTYLLGVLVSRGGGGLKGPRVEEDSNDRIVLGAWKPGGLGEEESEVPNLGECMDKGPGVGGSSGRHCVSGEQCGGQ